MDMTTTKERIEHRTVQLERDHLQRVRDTKMIPEYIACKLRPLRLKKEY